MIHHHSWPVLKDDPIVHSSASSALSDAALNPDLKAALVDLSLEMSIEEFIPEIRALPGLAALPIVILSGRDWSKQQAHNVGAQSFLRKPCDLNTLISTMKSIVGD